MNNKLVDLANKDSIYAESGPMLFGDSFFRQAKEREEQLRCLDKATGKGQQYFQRGRPQSYRRGGSSGGNRQGSRYHPF